MLTGLASVSLAATAGSLASCNKDEKRPAVDHQPKAPGQLNVVVHGMFVMLFDDTLNSSKTSLPLILMPPVVDMHAYGAGGWDAEQQLDRNACYQLKHVKSNIGLKLDPSKHAPLIKYPDKGSPKDCAGNTCVRDTSLSSTITFPYP